MPGINQLPSGSELAAAISLIWASASWICSSLLLWLTWSHHEGWSYLALLSISSLTSNTFSIIQEAHDITWYTDVITEQFERKQKLPAGDPELAIANGSFGLDLALYYIQYYSYSVQAMLVMFWAAELCQLTYRIGERRKIRRIFRKLHVAGKFVSWLLPMVTILCLRIPSLKQSFVAFILVADLPLMISLAIGSSLMIAVLVRYVRARQKFTQWSPPRFNSNTTSEGGYMYASGTGTQNTTHASTLRTRGLYDRWLMVRFTIAFVMLAIFEVTNTLFQITALNNDIRDAAAKVPDLSTARALQTLFLFMPGTTPGIFIFVVFGTTASSRRKLAELFLLKRWRESSSKDQRGRCFRVWRRGRNTPSPTSEPVATLEGGITVQRSLTVTSSSRLHGSQMMDDGEFSDPSDISMSDLPKRPESARSAEITYMKPLPPTPATPSLQFRTTATCASNTLAPPIHDAITTTTRALNAIEEKSVNIVADGDLTRTNTDDSMSLRVPGNSELGTEHSDDSGPILPIRRHQVRFSRDLFYKSRSKGLSKNKELKNFSRPRI